MHKSHQIQLNFW